jgi:hypothetical protein
MEQYVKKFVLILMIVFMRQNSNNASKYIIQDYIYASFKCFLLK